jgi:hypothetical protein
MPCRCGCKQSHQQARPLSHNVVRATPQAGPQAAQGPRCIQQLLGQQGVARQALQAVQHCNSLQGQQRVRG